MGKPTAPKKVQVLKRAKDKACSCPPGFHQFAMAFYLPSGKYVEIRTSHRLDEGDILDIVEGIGECGENSNGVIPNAS